MMELERILATEAKEEIGKKIRLGGWVASVRDHGQLLFIDLRDWSGRVQLVINPENKAVFEVAKDLGNEYVIEAIGLVKNRDSDLINPKLETGEIEVVVEELRLITKSETVPFPLDTNGHEIDENVRLKYRYVDMRRDRIKSIMKKRSTLLLAIRNYLDGKGFTEIQTPLLTTTSPEGARDFVIPSRTHKGEFFVLPQAPQQFKQLAMVGGVDKYYQIAPCMRDEDPRADRHAGTFYQIDIEMSFPTIDKIFATCEGMLAETVPLITDRKMQKTPFPRITHKEAQERYGSDKPDVRFDLELQDITEAVKDKTEFNIFNDAEIVKCLVVKGISKYSRKDFEALEQVAKEHGAGGLAYAKVSGKEFDGGIAKFINPIAGELIKAAGAKDGDTLLFGADKRSMVNKVLGAMRVYLGKELKLYDSSELSFIWVTDFPFYELDEKTGKLDFGHNPFSMPKGGLEAFETDDPLSIETYQYDLAFNGYEALSGSIRNHDPEVLVKAFETVGYDKGEIMKRFGGMYTAFQYGAPPHGGWAFGIDRAFMELIGETNIRDVYAFPKNSSGKDVMMGAPSVIPKEDLDVLGIELKKQPKVKK